MNINKWYYSKGRKKNSFAKVFIKEGKGKIIINNKNIFVKNYNSYEKIYEPFSVINNFKFDIKIFTNNGGLQSQIKAITIAISRNIANNFTQYKKILKENKLTNSDIRIVESKKTGYKKSRKKQQFSKR